MRRMRTRRRHTQDLKCFRLCRLSITPVQSGVHDHFITHTEINNIITQCCYDPGAVTARCAGQLQTRVQTLGNPVIAAIHNERRALLEELLNKIPEVQATALRLRFFGGLKFQEIADAMQCSLSSAKNRVKIGLEKLSQLIDDAEKATLAGEQNESSS